MLMLNLYTTFDKQLSDAQASVMKAYCRFVGKAGDKYIDLNVIDNAINIPIMYRKDSGMVKIISPDEINYADTENTVEALEKANGSDIDLILFSIHLVIQLTDYTIHYFLPITIRLLNLVHDTNSYINLNATMEHCLSAEPTVVENYVLIDGDLVNKMFYSKTNGTMQSIKTLQ